MARSCGPVTLGARLSELETNADGEVTHWSAEHDGYVALTPPVLHRRSVRLASQDRRIEIVDCLETTGRHAFRLAFHFGPDIQARMVDRTVELTWSSGASKRRATLSLPDGPSWSLARGGTDPVLGWYSPRFGEKQPTWAVIGEGACSGTGCDTLATVLQFDSVGAVPSDGRLSHRGIFSALACSYRSVAQLPELAGTGLVSPCFRGAAGHGLPSRLVEGTGEGGVTSIPRPGVLLDRDGTIIVDHGYVGSVDRVELIDGAAGGHRPAESGRGTGGGRDQPGRGRPRALRHIATSKRSTATLLVSLADCGAHIDAFFYCPYHPEGTVAEFARASIDRKPMPGMARAAAEALNLDLTSSWVVGDRPEDIGLAEAVGAFAVHVGPDATVARACGHSRISSRPRTSSLNG